MIIETSQVSVPQGTIDLGLGQPQLDLLPHQIIKEAAAKILDGSRNSCLNYGPARGDGYLRLALQGFLERSYGQAIDIEGLMITGGTSWALQTLSKVLAKPGDTILVEEPTFFLAHQIFKDAGLKVVGVPLGANGLQPDSLEEAIKKHKPRLLYTIPVHQNPSGATIPSANRQPLVDLCAKHRVIMLADEVYQTLSYYDEPPKPMAIFTDSEFVISMGSFSKNLGPGLRLGWIQASPKHLEKICSLGIFASGGGVNHFTGCIVGEVIRSGAQEEHLNSLRKLYRARVDNMDNLLQEHLGNKISYEKPKGGYFFWVRLNNTADVNTLLNKAAALGVGFRAGTRFSNYANFSSFIRLCFAHYPDEQIEVGINRLSKLIS